MPLCMDKKNELGVLSRILTKSLWTVCLLAILVFCFSGCTKNHYSIGGTVTGLAGSGLEIQNQNNGDNLSISANGTFTFASQVVNGDGCNVIVVTQPSAMSQICTVSNGYSSGPHANITNIVVSCVTVPHPVTVDPSGKFAYVANTVDNTISAYAITSITGVLTAVITGAVDAGTNPYSVTVDPSGQFAYVANYGSSNISVYTIGSDGSLTPHTVTPLVAAGTNPFAVTVVVNSSGKFAYVANYGSNNISVYTIGSDGSLTPGTAVAAGTNPYSVTVDPSGQFAYVANVGYNTISVYAIESDGSLTPGTAVAAGTNPFSVTVDPSGKFAYTTNVGDNTVSGYTIGTTGALTSTGPAIPFE